MKNVYLTFGYIFFYTELPKHHAHTNRSTNLTLLLLPCYL